MFNFKKITFLLMLLTMVSALFSAGSQDDSGTPQKAIEETQKIVWLLPAGESDQHQVDAVIAAFEAKHNIEVELEFRPAGPEGVNIVKTRIVAEDMPDLLTYNTGALFQALNPANNFVDLSGEAFSGRVLDSFKDTTSVGTDAYFGIPLRPMSSGGVIYNKVVYDKLGLSIPKTWDELLSNCEVIKEAGIVPIAASYKDAWSSQILLLADYFNVHNSNPDFADNYTNNKAKFSTDPAAMRGFEKLADIYNKGYINDDAATATYDIAQEMLATGKAAHYFMATWVISDLSNKYPDDVMQNMRFFAIPGDAPDSNGSTLWMPNQICIPSLSEKQEAARLFADYFVSGEGLAAYMNAGDVTGAFAIKGVDLPKDVLPSVNDAQAYIDAGDAVPALEYLSPLKGPNLPQLCVSAGLGLKTPAESASEYDRDVEKTAKQLQLAGW